MTYRCLATLSDTSWIFFTNWNSYQSECLSCNFGNKDDNPLSRCGSHYIYIYIYMCVCVCVNGEKKSTHKY